MPIASYNKTTWVNNQTPVNASNMNHLEDAVYENRQQIITNESNISGLDLRLDTAEGKITILENARITADGNISDLQSRTTTAERKVASLETDMSDVKDTVDALETQAGNEHLSTSSQTLSGAVNELASGLSSTSGNVGTLTNEVASLQTTTSSLQTRVNALENSTPVDITSAFTSSNSRVTIEKAYRAGRVVSVWVKIARTASWANGSNGDITSTITSDYLPILASTTSLAWGSGSIVGQFGGRNSHMNPGEMVFRNVSGGSISSSTTNPVSMYFDYVYGD